jgi:hypothetical protein
MSKKLQILQFSAGIDNYQKVMKLEFSSIKRRARRRHFETHNFNCHQGDQIWKSFAPWVIVYFLGSFF